ncbi:unknown [Feldmannia species virus]|uniref:HPt domain-containing protein n=1 Tax=Feldmannia species virus TaxID=39420 RepID=B5LWF0_9PHYC|nr:hypothetical protein FeldSpV_gp061 [Feldmannia species virus]ACH46813.1 unknown [Feldmannia species virus]
MAIDRKKLTEKMDGDDEFVAILLHDSRQEFQDLLRELRENGLIVAKAYTTAHNVKGCAANLECPLLFREASNLENLLETTKKKIDRVCAEISRVLKDMGQE